MDENTRLALKKEIILEKAHRRKQNPLKYHELLPMQELFKADTSTVRCLFGGNRSGKTEGVADDIVDDFSNKENLKIWVVGETFQDSVAIQQKKISGLLNKKYIKYGNYDEINGFTNRKVQHYNKSLITFKSYDQKREAFQSDDIDIIWNDEEVPYDIFKEQKMRLLDRNGKMIISMTSLKGVTELIEDLFEGHTILKSQYAPLVDEVLPRIAEKDGVRFYFLWTTENPHINQERTLAESKLMTKQEIKSRFYGIPVNLQGKIYPSFNKDVHVISREDMDIENCQIWHVLDPHDRKPWAIGWYAVHKTGSVCAIEEYPERNFNDMLYDDKTYDEYAKYIKIKESILMAGVRNKYIKRIIDPNFGNKTVQLAERQGDQSKTTPIKELAKRGLKYNDGIDAVEAGHLQVRQFLYWEEKDGELVVQPNLYIADNCQNHIRHLSRYSRKDIMTSDGDVKDQVKPKEAYKDFSDLIRYLCMSNPRFIVKKKFESTSKRSY